MTFGRHWIDWTAAVAVVPLLLLGACSQDDPQPTFSSPSDSPTTSEYPSDAASTSAPQMPRRASRHTDTGAKAFVAYWVEVFNYAQSSGDTHALTLVSDNGCKSCRVIAEAMANTYEEGGSVRGGALSIGRVRELPPDYGADWGGFAKGRSAPQIITSGTGEKERHAGSDFALYAYLSWLDDGWRMTWLRTPS